MGESPNLPVDPRQFKRDKRRVETGFWTKVRRTLGQVPFLEQAVAAYYCAVDRETPVQVKAVLMGALAYFVMPADVIPDFIAWMGFADDATVLALAIRSVEPHIKDRHRRQARATLAGHAAGHAAGHEAGEAAGEAAGEPSDPDARSGTDRTA